jgi:hypothetical protein
MSYYYVEVQRAVRCLRIGLIIMGLILVAAAIVRASVHYDTGATILDDILSSPTAHVSKTTLPDGSMREVVDDPAKRVHAVVTRESGGKMFHMDLTQPSDEAENKNDSDTIGNIHIRDIATKGGMEHLTIDWSGPPDIPFGYLVLSSIVAGFIAASVLGGTLAKENDGHLDLAWTKPVSRERYALTSFAVDITGILVTQALWVVMALIAILMFMPPHLALETNGGWHVAAALLAPIAWYAALTGWSASLNRGPGIVIGLGWLFGTLVPSIASATGNTRLPLIQTIHVVFQGLSYLDPLTFSSVHSGGDSVTISNGLNGAGHAVSVYALAALTVFYLAAAVAQWRRVEA